MLSVPIVVVSAPVVLAGGAGGGGGVLIIVVSASVASWVSVRFWQPTEPTNPATSRPTSTCRRLLDMRNTSSTPLSWAAGDDRPGPR